MWTIQRGALMSAFLMISLSGCAAPVQVPVDPALTRAPVVPELPEDATWRDVAEAHARTLDELRDCGERMRVIRGE
jgi:hypothetical protein